MLLIILHQSTNLYHLLTMHDATSKILP